MNSRKTVSLIMAILLCAVSLFSCAESKYVKVSDMSLEELEECVELGDYKGLELVLHSTGKEAALLLYLDENSCVKHYPDGTVSYYVEQLKKQYRYYAEQADIRYEAMLDELGEDNITMNAEAKRLVKNDLVFELIRKKEGIILTEEEKTAFFDKYVKKYAESYKYSEEYVRKELSELVYDSMLYDKTVEFLIINNSFTESDTAQSEQ